jgi:rubredoxin
MKCSFCDQPLACKACGQPFRPRQSMPHLAVYQPDMQVACPACHKVLVCKLCGYVYGEEEEMDE